MNVAITSGALFYNIIIIVVCTAYVLVKDRAANRGKPEDLALSGRSMHWLPCAAAIALTALGGGHINGLGFTTWEVGYAATFFAFGSGFSMIVTFRFTGMWFRRSGCVTVNELMGKMFHPAIAPMLGALGIMYCWLVICVETQGMAPVISLLTGTTNFQAGFIGAAVGVLYMIVAGMKQIGVVNLWNAILMYIFGFIALFYLGFNQGGFEAVNSSSFLAQNPELLHALGNPAIFRAYVVGTFLSGALGLNMAQPQVQAIAAVENVSVLKKACIAAIPMNMLICAIIIALAMMGKALPLSSAMENGAEGLIGVALMYLPSWLQICLLGSFLAAVLSTFAMCVLVGVTQFTRDTLGYFPAYRNMSHKKHAVWNRVWILVFAFSSATVAVTIRTATLGALTWGFAWNIPTFLIFIVGLYWKRSPVGGLVAFLVSWALNIVLTFTPLAAVFGLEGNNYSIFMMIASLVVGLIATALDKNAKPSFKKTYKMQRAEYDAARGALPAEQ